jgi:hypothetical protein
VPVSADVIIAMDGKEMNTSTEFAAAIDKHKAGERVTITVMRGTQNSDTDYLRKLATDPDERSGFFRTREWIITRRLVLVGLVFSWVPHWGSYLIAPLVPQRGARYRNHQNRVSPGSAGRQPAWIIGLRNNSQTIWLRSSRFRQNA